MFYAFAYTLTSDDLVTAKYTLDMNLTAGVIHQVDVLFQKDCAHKINVQIFQGGHQLWPSNRGASMRGDAIIEPEILACVEWYYLVDPDSGKKMKCPCRPGREK